MSLTEKYRPQTASEIIGNEKAITKLKGVILSRGRAYVYGDPGIGKTTAVLALANDLGLKVVEYNASDVRRKGDIESLRRRASTTGFQQVVYLIDEVDGMSAWGELSKLLVETKHPVVLIANRDDKVDNKVKKVCTKIRFYRPRVDQVLARIRQIAKEEGISNIDTTQVTEDVRSSINAVFFGGMGRDVGGIFDEVKAILTTGRAPSDFKTKDLIWVLDNLHRFLYGIDLAKAVEVVNIAFNCDRPSVLEALPRGSGNPQFPYFLRRASVLRREKKKNG